MTSYDIVGIDVARMQYSERVIHLARQGRISVKVWVTKFVI